MIIDIQNIGINKNVRATSLADQVPAPPHPQNIVPVANTSKHLDLSYNILYNASLTTNLWLPGAVIIQLRLQITKLFSYL